MECASCGEQTTQIPCVRCGEEPRLAGQYRLLAPIGHGGAGTIWRARFDPTGETVAVKEMLLAGARSAAREAWQREVALLRQLDHPQIPRFIDAFHVGRGASRRLVLVQELVPGRSLAEELDVRRYGEDEVIAIARSIWNVLDYLHSRQPPVIHRDLKPANIMRRPDGTLVLVDFGSARDWAGESLGRFTVAGTFGHMAPEQFRGEASPATDAYGVGGLMVALLTRRALPTLLDARGRLCWRNHCRVSSSTARVIDALLADDPAQRPVGSEAFERALAGRNPTLPVPVGTPVTALAGLMALTAMVVSAGRVLPGSAPVLAARRPPLPVLDASPSSHPARSAVPLRQVWNAGETPLWTGTTWLEPGGLAALPAVGEEEGTLQRCDGEGCVPVDGAPLGEPIRSPSPAWPVGIPGDAVHRCPVTLWVGVDGAPVRVEPRCGDRFDLVAAKVLGRWTYPEAEQPRVGTVVVRFDPGPKREVYILGEGNLEMDGHPITAPWVGPLGIGTHVLRAGERERALLVPPGNGALWVRVRPREGATLPP